jgi:hypothetical protein
MKTNIEIENKLYNDIVSYCVVNGIEPDKYIEKALRERLATDKYGDLNQKIHKIEEPVETTVTKEEIHIISSEPLTEENELVDVPHDVSESGDFANAMKELVNDKKTKRTLKTK